MTVVSKMKNKDAGFSINVVHAGKCDYRIECVGWNFFDDKFTQYGPAVHAAARIAMTSKAELLERIKFSATPNWMPNI